VLLVITSLKKGAAFQAVTVTMAIIQKIIQMICKKKCNGSSAQFPVKLIITSQETWG